MNSILITGAGTLARELVKQLQVADPDRRVVIFSRSESRQHEMMQEYPEGGRTGLRYVIGDVRDYERLCRAMENIDTVIHTAALKRIEVCQYNPQEAIRTNVIGSTNVIDAAIDTGVRKVLTISTDKAVEAISCYGSTKAVMEQYAIASNVLSAGTRTSVVRYANVRGSTGSVLTIWEKQAQAGLPLTITDPNMTRMWIDKHDAAAFILDCVDNMEGGEIFIPKCDIESLMQMKNRHFPAMRTEITGLRSDEKLHETLVSQCESRRCYEQENGTYIIYPYQHDWRETWNYKGKRVPKDWSYVSGHST
jgi:UDP-N-acetylglucosamine 4,6-dehydratase